MYDSLKLNQGIQPIVSHEHRSPSVHRLNCRGADTFNPSPSSQDNTELNLKIVLCKMPKKAERYTNDILSRPGMVFAVDVKDPKERVQAYLDSYKNDQTTVSSFYFTPKHLSN